MPLFRKVLIANRGAIATRIIRTLDRLGIESVAVYAESDRNSLHVQRATEAFSLGEGAASKTYLDADRLLRLAKESGCEAIHPGYGFLSENADFVEQCDAASIAFIGPTADHIRQFGQKHRARALAEAADVPLPPGSGLLADVDSALQAAEDMGYPVMLKSTAGGGGIGMQWCKDASTLQDAFKSVKRLSEAHFANDGVFIEKAIEKARHIEVQVFGDGQGNVICLGERDCSAQRRNQKVLEECPAPNLTATLRQQLHDTAEKLMAHVSYRNAGTVEFIVDAESQAFYFLEVNTRLQVEHGVTEMVYRVDLVEWMVRLACQSLDDLSSIRSTLEPSGHAIQVRVYAEDPFRQFQPCPGALSDVSFPSAEYLRIDHWVESGITVSADFDPMLAKVIAFADSRAQALQRLSQALSETRLYGSETNLDYLQALSYEEPVKKGLITTRYLDTFQYAPHRIDVIRGGTMTTIQDYPGRSGYWSVGIPPSGPFDTLSFQLANRLLGNDAGAAGLEITVQGPVLRFSSACQVVIAGAEVEVTVDDEAVACWKVLSIRAGQQLEIGSLKSKGARVYLCVRYGIQCPEYLGSRSTFTLGRFGGHNGSALKAGDVLRLIHSEARNAGDANAQTNDSEYLPESLRPVLSHTWSLRVIVGPHSAPDFFTEKDKETFFSTDWEVHYNSSRTGVRLIGPTPEWARSDGGEAGLHPSNIHDNAYAFGTVDFTGDMPVILGPDGPSLGGFVCPATVITADLWMIGQLRPGDTVCFQPVSLDTAVAVDRRQQEFIAAVGRDMDDVHINSLSVSDGHETGSGRDHTGAEVEHPDSEANESSPAELAPVPVVMQREDSSAKAVYRVAGDRFLLVEYGEPVLDIAYRFRVYALMQWIDRHPLTGILEMTPGIRSLQIHYDTQVLRLQDLVDHLLQAESELDESVQTLRVPSRIVHLPLSWDDEACRVAIEKYNQVVRKDAPWYPSNLEFIRRINGLESVEDVKAIVFDASYLVMGLGDVYLGAPVATPVNPAHRLVTTKYNPARTWTAENSVGIGGSYLCIYGMEGPGGYQFVGRTLQMWNRYRTTDEFSRPWLLRFFDQIRFFEVSHQELDDIRRDFPYGRYPLRIEETDFSLQDYRQLLNQQADTINNFETKRTEAFGAELDRWRETGQFSITHIEQEHSSPVTQSWPDTATVIESPVSGSVWQCHVEPGDQVSEGQALLILESMKMEISVAAPKSLRVSQVLGEPGQKVSAGQVLVVMEES